MAFTGKIVSVLFEASDNGYVVAKMDVETPKVMNGVTITGNTPMKLKVGMKLKIEGIWTTHKKFGSQFKFTELIPVMPTKIREIEEYLSTGIIKCIGPELAKRIVKVFGEDTLNILDNDPDQLIRVNGIGNVNIEMIKDSYVKNRKSQELIIFLQKYKISQYTSLKLFKFYGNSAIDVVKNTPYRLIQDIHGIGFKTADEIAMSMGFKKDSIDRVKAAIYHILLTGTNSGHCYIPKNFLIEKVFELIGVNKELINDGIEKLVDDGRVGYPEKFSDRIYLKFILKSEMNSAKNIIRHLDIAPAFVHDINVSLTNSKVELTDAQQSAIKKAFEQSISIITGGPGVGKSTIIDNIIKVSHANDLHVLLAAPTGKAAKRMSEITRMEAKTIHRLLEYNPKEHTFMRNKTNKLDCDVLVIDEMSMVDIVLFDCLMDAIAFGTSVVLVGDIDQLPSVGAGNVLKDLISSKKISVTELDVIFRQAQESMIIVNAHNINHGKFIEVDEVKKDFIYVEEDDNVGIHDSVIDWVCKTIPDNYSIDPILDVQVLVPRYKGDVGINTFNAKIQQCLNQPMFESQNKFVQRGFVRFCVGDKVMQTRNDYDKEVFNGDVGVIKNVVKEYGMLTVEFNGRLVPYEKSDLDDLILAYAISIHKSQGSQFKIIVIPIAKEHGALLLQRNLLYTAVTRAKELVVLIGQKEAIKYTIRNNTASKRYTSLVDFIQ